MTFREIGSQNKANACLLAEAATRALHSFY